MVVNTIVAGDHASSSNDFYGAYSGGNNLIGGNPQLALLDNYGGPTLTVASRAQFPDGADEPRFNRRPLSKRLTNPRLCKNFVLTPTREAEA